MLKRGIKPDALTDQTSAHDPANGYCPAGWSVAKWQEMRERDPAAVAAAARESMARHVEAMLCYKDMGVPTFDYGNNIRQEAKDMGVTHAFDFGFVPAYVRPAPTLPRDRPVPVGGLVRRSGRHLSHRPARVKELIPDDPHLHRWLDMARERIAFQGLPAHLLGRPRPSPSPRPRLQRDGAQRGWPPRSSSAATISTAVAIASPNRETESMKDGSDVVSDWPLLNALLNTASTATGFRSITARASGWAIPQHAGMVIVADGGDDAARRPRAGAVERPRHRRDAPRRRGL